MEQQLATSNKSMIGCELGRELELDSTWTSDFGLFLLFLRNSWAKTSRDVHLLHDRKEGEIIRRIGPN